MESQAEVVVANGAVELIYLLPLLLRPQRVLAVEPGVAEYAAACRAAGAEVRQLRLSPTEGFSLRPGELKASLAGAGMCFLGLPNIPTGDLLMDPEALGQVAIRHPECLFVLDQSFADFVSPRRWPAWPEPLVGFAISFKTFPAVANFLLVYRGEKAPPSRELEEALGKRGLLIRRYASFGGLDGRFVRVAVRLPWENRRLLRALEEVLAEGR